MEWIKEIAIAAFTFLTTLSATFAYWQFLLFIVILILGYLILNYKKTENFWKSIIPKFNVPKISCENCFQILQSKTSMMRTSIEKIENKILKSQMNYVEQRLVEILFIFVNNFSKVFKGKVDEDEVYTFLLFLKDKFKNDSELVYKINEALEKLEIDKEIIQTKIYWSIIYESLEKIVKDEIRRSFKENGFHAFNDLEFSVYLKTRQKVIIQLVFQQIINLYPKAAGMLLSQDEIICMSENLLPSINMIIDEMYINAKKIKSESEKEIQKIENQYKDEMNIFIRSLMR